MTPAPPDLHRLAAQVIVPVLDLRAGRDRAAEWARAEARARAGFGAFLLFGGELPELPERLAALRACAPAGQAPLVCADLERGLGQQVRGGGRVPPAMALGAAGSPALARRAGLALGREARAAGVDWVLGPVLDLADEPRNPIVGTRAFSADPARVATLGAAWIEGLEAAGVLGCAKHFPGHGATTDDSHAALPRVSRSAAQLRARDLLPFRAAAAVGVGSVMTAHVAYPTLDEPGPATLSPRLVTGLLRGELGYHGLVVTDALIMDGVRADGEDAAACAALAAGCDVLLYPHEPEAVAAAVARWASAEPARAGRLQQAAGRLAAARLRLAAALAPGGPPDRTLALDLARAALVRSGPAQPALQPGDPVGLVLLDDDQQGGFGAELLATLLEAGLRVRVLALHPGSDASQDQAAAALLGDAPRGLVVVGCRVRAWKGRPGLHPRLQTLLRGLPPRGLTVVGLCGPAPLAPASPPGAASLLAWGDEPAAQRAAAEALLGRITPAGRSPAAP